MIGYTPVEEDIRQRTAALNDLLGPSGPVAELLLTGELEVTIEPGASVITIRFSQDGETDGIAAVEAMARAMDTMALLMNGIWIAVKDCGGLWLEAVYAPPDRYARIDALLAGLRREARDLVAAKAGAAA